ncbi:MAG: hypothetical protein PHU80_05745 [Kiritimatiellae bacterium]|nr:hypothetical protein [Kiritimatiellia bacterium]
MSRLDTYRVGYGACILLLSTLPAFGLSELKDVPEAALQAKTDHELHASRAAEMQRAGKQQALEQSSLRAKTLFALKPEQVDRLTRGVVHVEDILNAQETATPADEKGLQLTEETDASIISRNLVAGSFQSRLKRFLLASLLVAVSGILLYRKTGEGRKTR